MASSSRSARKSSSVVARADGNAWRPGARNSRARRKPRPREPPVMMTTRPFKVHLPHALEDFAGDQETGDAAGGEERDEVAVTVAPLALTNDGESSGELCCRASECPSAASTNGRRSRCGRLRGLFAGKSSARRLGENRRGRERRKGMMRRAMAISLLSARKCERFRTGWSLALRRGKMARATTKTYRSSPVDSNTWLADDWPRPDSQLRRLMSRILRDRAPIR